MVTEIAILKVRPDLHEAFERDFKLAGCYISAIQGYQGHSLKKSLEEKDQYLLIAYWDTLEAHVEGFRGSMEYQEWKALLHPYYDPHPRVEHYEDIIPFG